MKLGTHPLLKFDAAKDDLTKSLSAALFVGDTLWLASDEETSIERLSTSDGETFQNHKSFPLDKLINLPAQDTDADQEIDIEGLDFRDSHLWLVGSHSIKRKNVKRDDKSGADGTDKKSIKKLATEEAEGNRFILARIPLVTNADTGEQELISPVEDPPGSGKILKAAQLSGGVKHNDLTEAIKHGDVGEGNTHLAKFLDIPGKDNGFDIEGLAVAQEKVFLGLRGPVLRGWAVILELSIETSDPSKLSLNNFGPNNLPYRKYFLDLHGLGVRELCLDGDDLLILAGPTTTLDGPVALYRWKGAVNFPQHMLVRGDKLVRLPLDIPVGEETDHPEGFTIFPGDEQPRQILVVYDSPGKLRKGDAGEVRADVFDLPTA